jgi:predicted double-glycine peptidase
MSGTRYRALLAAALLLLLNVGPLLATELQVPIGGASGIGLTVRQQVSSVDELRKQGIAVQQLDYSCGSAALATLFNSYLQQPVTEQEIIGYILTNGDLRKIVERHAFSLLDLKRFAQSRGVEAEGYSLSFDDLVELHLPVLVPIILRDYKHFVIFRGARDDRVYLADPSFGRWTTSRVEFERMWNPRVGLAVWRKDRPASAGNPLALTKEDDIYVSHESASSLSLRTGATFTGSPSEF